MEKRIISRDNGELVTATFPAIVSASRSTDIPAFYADWFFYRLRKGYSCWINVFNNKKYYIGYDDTRFIVFWSKNPKPLLNYLDYLDKRQIGCYIQFTLNDYESDGLESGLPPLADRISTFKALVQRLGKGSVIWRFDPLVLTDTLSIDTLLEKIRYIGNQVHEDTEKLVFSFADILKYKKVRMNMKRSNIPYHEWTLEEMQDFAGKLVELNNSEGWRLQLATCGEMANLSGIRHNSCVDANLILRLCPRASGLLEYLGAEVRSCRNLFETRGYGSYIGNLEYMVTVKKKDKGQRKTCGCVRSKDIGQYNTCAHLCEYCYANYNKETVLHNYALHKHNKYNDTITGQ